MRRQTVDRTRTDRCPPGDAGNEEAAKKRKCRVGGQGEATFSQVALGRRPEWRQAELLRPQRDRLGQKAQKEPGPAVGPRPGHSWGRQQEALRKYQAKDKRNVQSGPLSAQCPPPPSCLPASPCPCEALSCYPAAGRPGKSCAETPPCVTSGSHAGPGQLLPRVLLSQGSGSWRVTGLWAAFTLRAFRTGAGSEGHTQEGAGSTLPADSSWPCLPDGRPGRRVFPALPGFTILRAWALLPGALTAGKLPSSTHNASCPYRSQFLPFLSPSERPPGK